MNTFTRILLAATLMMAIVGSRAQTAPSPGGPIPADFRGKIVYKGTYSAERTVQSSRSQNSTEFSGALTLTLEFKGPAVTGVIRTTGPLRPNRISGLHQNGTCKLYDSGEISGPCTLGSFNGTMRTEKGRTTLVVNFETTAAEMIDFAVRDEQRRQQAQRQEAEAEAKREDDVRWFRGVAEEAERGSRTAQFQMAIAFATGKGTTKNEAEVFKWALMAAKQGLPEAQHAVALGLDAGSGTKIDRVEALKWYRAAAQQNNAASQLQLGNKYARGEGVVEDFVKAYMWLTLAGASGNANDETRDRAEQRRRLLAERMTSEQVTQAQRAAAECQKRQYRACD